MTKIRMSTYQTGNGFSIFRAPALQRGYGIGGIFKGLLRTFTPLIKKGLLSAGKKVLNMGVNALEDMSKNKIVKRQLKFPSSIKKTINRETKKRKQTIPNVVNQQTTSRKRKQRQLSKNNKSTKRKRTEKRITDVRVEF